MQTKQVNQRTDIAEDATSQHRHLDYKLNEEAVDAEEAVDKNKT